MGRGFIEVPQKAACRIGLEAANHHPIESPEGMGGFLGNVAGDRRFGAGSARHGQELSACVRR